MISNSPEWWAFLTYNGFKSHVNFTEGLKVFPEDRIKVGKEEDGRGTFNQSYDKLQANKNKKTTI